GPDYQEDDTSAQE
ncbi:hypothetical protein A2U01_0110888, partial [Trifolium medium]|nr:hypothetical protein [Trifolium medium]